VSRRRRAILFGVAAVLCALGAATVAGRYRTAADARYGDLRPVLVASADIPAGTMIGPEQAAKSLSVRRIPSSFVPPTALRRPEQALGMAPGASIPAGSYVIGAQLAVPAPAAPATPGAGQGRSPVQVSVTGAEALTFGGAAPEGSRVDVVIAQRSGLGNDAKTYVAASGVRLLALRSPQGSGQGWSATLAVNRDQALELIEAEAAAREIRLLPS
jgi:Flp pilus assembly protein CpaB